VSGQNRATPRLDHLVNGLIDLSPNRVNAAIANQQVATHDGIAIVHRHNGAVFDEDRLHWKLLNRADYGGIG